MKKLLYSDRRRRKLSNQTESSEEKEKQPAPKIKVERQEGEPTAAFKGASWAALLVGVTAYFIGLFNATMPLNETGYYLAVLVLGLYSAVSLQKSVRDKDEGIPVTNMYYGISWIALIVSILLMAIGLYNAESIVLSEKGFYGMSFVLSLFASITVQKNIRDTQRARERN
ncbi:hypothetical protein P799_04740 [Lysinibacillus sphaericus CBAM5]|uniref:Inner membrane protein n=2 Tax=Lysinibacillus sphaericus TaxID=1421 RepID=B1HSE2_LYSSC|nr:Inner membrane protein [Lysinibacillus sphaericus C3-41]EWH34863.1 hypothetical protein P799_04740 [Lysinibacillus sphaericus CBAM5]